MQIGKCPKSFLLLNNIKIISSDVVYMSKSQEKSMEKQPQTIR